MNPPLRTPSAADFHGHLGVVDGGPAGATISASRVERGRNRLMKPKAQHARCHIGERPKARIAGTRPARDSGSAAHMKADGVSSNGHLGGPVRACQRRRGTLRDAKGPAA